MSDRLKRSMALMDAKADVKMIKERANECWYDTKILANAVYLILEELVADRKTESDSEKQNNCEDEPQTESQYDFGAYADRLREIAYERGKREALEQTEPSCDTCKLKGTTEWCKRQEVCRAYKPKDEPQRIHSCSECKDKDECIDAYTEISQYCGALTERSE